MSQPLQNFGSNYVGVLDANSMLVAGIGNIRSMLVPYYLNFFMVPYDKFLIYLFILLRF